MREGIAIVAIAPAATDSVNGGKSAGVLSTPGVVGSLFASGSRIGRWLLTHPVPYASRRRNVFHS